MDINRRGFIGAMMASAAALAVGPAAEEEFQDLRMDRYYIWRLAKPGHGVIGGWESGQDLRNSIVRFLDRDWPDDSLDSALGDLEDMVLKFEQYADESSCRKAYCGGVPESEREIRATKEWMLELYRRHKHDVENS